MAYFIKTWHLWAGWYFREGWIIEPVFKYPSIYRWGSVYMDSCRYTYIIIKSRLAEVMWQTSIITSTNPFLISWDYFISHIWCIAMSLLDSERTSLCLSRGRRADLLQWKIWASVCVWHTQSCMWRKANVFKLKMKQLPLTKPVYSNFMIFFFCFQTNLHQITQIIGQLRILFFSDWTISNKILVLSFSRDKI